MYVETFCMYSTKRGRCRRISISLTERERKRPVKISCAGTQIVFILSKILFLFENNNSGKTCSFRQSPPHERNLKWSKWFKWQCYQLIIFWTSYPKVLTVYLNCHTSVVNLSSIFHCLIRNGWKSFVVRFLIAKAHLTQ